MRRVFKGSIIPRMRALLVHARDYDVKVIGLATRPNGVAPEAIIDNEQTVKNCIVGFLCVETGDEIDAIKSLSTEIVKMMKETGEQNVVIAPFAHLSNKLADSHTAKRLLGELENELIKFKPVRTHFGSDKELLLSVFGHPGSVRFREF